jgi:hypothetical protein
MPEVGAIDRYFGGKPVPYKSLNVSSLQASLQELGEFFTLFFTEFA